jgi:hypothetical protein
MKLGECKAFTVQELRGMCKARGVEGYWNMRKGELIKECCLDPSPEELERVMQGELEWAKGGFERIGGVIPLRMEENRGVSLRVRPDMRRDDYRSGKNEIHMGIKEYIHNARLRRKEIVHEYLHSLGVPHGPLARAHGFRSKIWRDRLSEKVMREALDWQPPTEEDYRRASELLTRQRLREEEERDRKSSWTVYCGDCDYETHRVRKSKIVKDPGRYLCPRCKARLRSRKKG